VGAGFLRAPLRQPLRPLETIPKWEPAPTLEWSPRTGVRDALREGKPEDIVETATTLSLDERELNKSEIATSLHQNFFTFSPQEQQRMSLAQRHEASRQSQLIPKAQKRYRRPLVSSQCLAGVGGSGRAGEFWPLGMTDEYQIPKRKSLPLNSSIVLYDGYPISADPIQRSFQSRDNFSL